MAIFMAITACNDPKINNHEAVEAVIRRYEFHPDFHVGVNFDERNGSPYFFAYGAVWPEAWRHPVAGRQLIVAFREGGTNGFLHFLKEIAPYLREPLTVHAIGSTKCRFPLSATQYCIRPGSKRVRITRLFKVGKRATV